MSQSISIAPLLWNHQVFSCRDSQITHGKGHKGIIIRCKRQSQFSRIKDAFYRRQK